ncbi:tetratricopeptide repeat protein [Roseiconus lacunae]|uniref:tetratricopeptide repeat protein n=1 Tax=Roseiconus lacunae TaxID=2605694 RepID=UPI001E34DD4E|nr:hypothetical protein [Roseiconus lacunae]MCD0462056.1 hypothetical protein [Roseiconus lacunae]
MAFQNHFAHDEDFANFCVRLMNAVFNCTSFQKYAKRGESQDGIDIIDMAHGSPFRAGQCKLHEPHKTCPPKEIREEVEKAAGSDFDLDEFYILTSGRKTRHADNAVLEINKTKSYGQSFTTFVWSWEEIQTKLDELDPIAHDHVVSAGKNGSLASFKAIAQRIQLESVTNSEQSGNVQLQARFTQVETHIKNSDRDLARYELEQIELVPEASQNAGDRYLLHRLNAKYLMMIGKFDEAAQRFFKAFNERPELDQARINRALALELVGRSEDAWKQASELLREGIRTEPLPSIAYRCAPRPHSEEVKCWYEEQIETSEELNLVLADEARQEGRLEDSIRYSEKAIQLNENSARGFVLRGIGNHGFAFQGEPRFKSVRLAKAESNYEHVISLEQNPLPDGLIADVYRNLGNVRFLLGRPNPEVAFEHAIAKAEEKFPYVEQYLSFLCTTCDFAKAKSVIAEFGIDEYDLNQRLLKLVVERNTREEGCTTDFAGKMIALYSEGDFQRRDECLGFVVQWCIDESKPDKGIRLLQETADTLHPFQLHCCLAWLHHVSKDETKARETAVKAKELLADDSPFNYVAMLARVFVFLDEDQQALPLLKQASDCTRLTDETRELLDCAQRLQQHDVLLDVCRTLRANNSDTDATRSMELQILFGYVPKEAEELVEQLLEEHPEERGLYAWLCHIKTRLHGVYDQLQLSKLPTADQVTVFESQRVLAPLLASSRYTDAVRYAYEVLRYNQDDEIAHGRYLWTFMQFARQSDLKLDPSVAGPECVVVYSESGGELKTILIEKDLYEKRFDGEVAEDNELAKLLQGKKAGDTFSVSVESLQPREIKIDAIVSKFVYRYQRVLAEFQLNFPHANTIQMMKVLDGEELNLSPIKKSLEQRREHCESVISTFREHPLPISALAAWLGIGFYDAHGVLASMPDIGIRTGFNSNPENGHVFKRKQTLDPQQHIVLDPSAVVVIEKLELWDSLCSYHPVVTRSLHDQFAGELERLEENKSEGTLLLNDQGDVRFQEFPAEELEERTRVAAQLVSNIEQHCDVLDSLSAASVDQRLRQCFDQAGAFSVLESIAVAASDSKFLLWSDEAFIQATACTDFSQESISVQQVLENLRQSGALSYQRRDQAVARLMGWNYNPVYWNADTAFASALLSKWDPTAWPFTSILAQFEKNHWALRAKTKTALELFIKIYRSSAGDISETTLLLAVMNAIGTRKAAEWIRADAYEACMPHQDLLDSIRVSMDVWADQWIGR